jgi:hypothetical protein
MSERSEGHSTQARIAEVVRQLPEQQRRELLDFADRLRERTPRPARRADRAGLLRRLAGSLRDVLSSTDEFSKRKAEEKAAEERRWRCAR